MQLLSIRACMIFHQGHYPCLNCFNDWMILYTSLLLISLMANICWVGLIYSLKLVSIAGKTLARRGPTCVKWWFKTLLISLEEEWVTSSILMLFISAWWRFFPTIMFTPLPRFPSITYSFSQVIVITRGIFWQVPTRRIRLSFVECAW